MLEEVKDQPMTLQKINKIDKEVGHCTFAVDDRMLKKMHKLVL